MKRTSVLLATAIATLALTGSTYLHASTYKVIYTFLGGSDGETPIAQMIADSAGNLYGTTEFGGIHRLGTVFKLTRATDGTFTETVLWAFDNGTGGGQPAAILTLDAAGNIYGTTSGGGDQTCTSSGAFCGVVFELSPNSNGTWSESVLHTFTGTDGLNPQAGVTFDTAGNLYGTTLNGGPFGRGTVFRLSPNGDGTWTESVIHGFAETGGGSGADSTPVFDSAGNLYGTAAVGGTTSSTCFNGCGTVFELKPQAGGTWSTQILHRFNGNDGAGPYGIVIDAAGNLFGATTSAGQCQNTRLGGCGSVYELKAVSGGSYQFHVIEESSGKYAANPNPVIVDASGNVFGTGRFGGLQACSFGCGSIFELSPNSQGGFNLNGLYEFPGGTDGNQPYAGLTMDSSGNIYGTTGAGGDLSCESFGGCGVAFQIVP